MPLYIRDDDVHALAQRVARARGTTVTEAVRLALAREAGDLDAELAARQEALRRLFAEFDASPSVAEFGDAEMYGEDGLPR